MKHRPYDMVIEKLKNTVNMNLKLRTEAQLPVGQLYSTSSWFSGICETDCVSTFKDEHSEDEHSECPCQVFGTDQAMESDFGTGKLRHKNFVTKLKTGQVTSGLVLIW